MKFSPVMYCHEFKLNFTNTAEKFAIDRIDKARFQFSHNFINEWKFALRAVAVRWITLEFETMKIENGKFIILPVFFQNMKIKVEGEGEREKIYRSRLTQNSDGR